MLRRLRRGLATFRNAGAVSRGDNCAKSVMEP
jgi:hypothetical protein